MDENKQQIASQILKKYNLSGYVPSDKKNVDTDQRIKELREAVKSTTVEQQKKTIPERIADFTGGKELAQGLGQAIAQPAISKQIQETQKQQFDLQGQLLQKIKEGKQAGQDVSRLEKALGFINEDIAKAGEEAGALLNPNELTGKQVVGDVLQLGTTLATAGQLPGIAKATTQTPGIVAGALQGAKTGVISGGAFGGATGVSQGLQEDKTAEEILKQGALGVLGGAATGLVLGGATGAISGGLKASKIKKENQFLDAITPNTKNIPAAEYEKLVAQGKIAPKVGRTPDRYILSEDEIATATKYKGILGKDPVQNTINISEEIAKKDEEVGQFLKKNNGIFNNGELKNSLAQKLANIDDLTVDEARLAKLKESTINNFMKSLKKNDMETLWKARKDFDRKIESAFSGSPTLQKEIKKEFRNAVQDFIAERTPDNVYKSTMQEMSKLFNLRDITATKASSEKGVNAIQAWIKANPGKSKLIGWGGGAAGLGFLGLNS